MFHKDDDGYATSSLIVLSHFLRVSQLIHAIYFVTGRVVERSCSQAQCQRLGQYCKRSRRYCRRSHCIWLIDMTILPPRIFSCIAGVSNEQCRNRYVLYESYDDGGWHDMKMNSIMNSMVMMMLKMITYKHQLFITILYSSLSIHHYLFITIYS